MLNRVRSLINGTSRTAQAAPAADTPLAIYWDGGENFLPLTQKSGRWVEWEGSPVSLGNWLSPSSGLVRDLLGDDGGFATAYLTCEWVFRALEVRSLKIAQIMRRGQIVDAAGQAQTASRFQAAIDVAFRQYHQKFWREWASSRDLYGEAYIEPVRTVYPGTSITAGIGALRVLKGLFTEPVIAGGRIVGYDYADDEGHYTRLAPAQVIMDRRYHPASDLRGLSLLTSALDAVNIDRTQVMVTRNFLRNNARPGIVFTLKENISLTPDQRKQISDTIKEKAQGAKNAGNTLFMPAALDVTTIPAPTYSEGSALTDEQRRRISTTTGVPSALVDYTDQAYQLSPVQMQNFYDLTLLPEADDLKLVVNAHLLPLFEKGARFELPVEDIRAELTDPQMRTQTASQQYKDGVLSRHEYRRAIGASVNESEPDYYLFPQGVVVVPADQIGNAAALVTAARPQPLSIPGGASLLLPQNNNEQIGMQKAQPSRFQCMECSAPPTKEVLWAEGMARAWFCDRHFASWSAEHPGEVVSLHEVTNGEVPTKWGGKSTSVVQLPASAVTKSGTPRAELNIWRKKALKGNALKSFVAYTLPKHIEAWVRDELEVIGADAAKAHVNAVFYDAEAVLGFWDALKAYSDTREAFRAEVASIIDAANKDENTRRQFAGALRSALRRSGLAAFRDGMNDGGYDPESLSSDELTIFQAWLAESSDYVTNIGASLFKDGATPDPDQRADLWANKSLDDVYYAGLRIGGPNMRATWGLGNTIDHCHDTADSFGCAERHGQTKTIDEWGKIGFPRDRRLTCGGWQCDCDLYDDNGNRIGAR